MITAAERKASKAVTIQAFIDKEMEARDWTAQEFANRARLPLEVIERLLAGSQERSRKITAGIGQIMLRSRLTCFDDA